MFELSGLWLAGALALAFVAGVFLSTTIKDKLKGVPSSLRSALSATESSAMAELAKAKSAVVNDVTNLFHKSAVATAATAATASAVAAAPAPAPAPAAPVAPAAPAAPAASSAASH